MPILRYKGHPVLASFSSSCGTWAGEGAEVEVSDSDAKALGEVYPDLFEVVGAAPAAPAKNRAVASPKKKAPKRKAAPKKAAKGGD